MQLLVGVYGLGCIKQVFHELAAQVHIHFFKGAFTLYKPLKVLIDVLPLDILPICQFLEVGEEIPLSSWLCQRSRCSR